jgi:hypothetical protein
MADCGGISVLESFVLCSIFVFSDLRRNWVSCKGTIQLLLLLLPNQRLGSV